MNFISSIDFTPSIMLKLGVAAAVLVLLLLLVASFMSRAKVFCQYLKFMTGIELQPRTVNLAYKKLGRGGVRDMLISLLIQEDLADEARIVTPDSKPDLSVFDASE
jgi:hypothetical protein